MSGDDSVSLVVGVKAVGEQFLSDLSVLSGKCFRQIDHLYPGKIRECPFQPVVQRTESVFPVPARQNPDDIKLRLRLLSGNQTDCFPDTPDDFLVRIDVQVVRSQHHEDFLCVVAVQFAMQDAPLDIFDAIPSAA